MIWGVLGNQGLFGSDLEHTLLSTGEHAVGFNRSNLDLQQTVSEIASRIRTNGQFDILVNAIAYTAVDKAESEPDRAMRVNGDYSGKLALVAKELGARFVHISTDYVFDGNSNTAYQPEDRTNPQSAYGRSKLAGEVAVQESGADYQIFRTAWLYGANGPCFPKTVKKMLADSGLIKVVADQIGQPTWTNDLAMLILAHSISDASTRPRTIHATASGQASWFEFAEEIARTLGYNPKEVIQAITTVDHPKPAKRPAFSVLDNQNETGLAIGDWRQRWKEAAALVLGE